MAGLFCQPDRQALMTKPLRALGLMSGTSLDGIDLAVIETDGVAVGAFGPARTVPYDEELRHVLRACFGGQGPLADAEKALTLAHARAVQDFLRDQGAQVDVIGFHGQTVMHRPERRETLQLGDGALLARLAGVDVVNDFRTADVKAGGQGAPLVPLYHAALARGLDRPLAVLNIGGVANVTYLGPDEGILAFDTGPGNAPLDDWMRAHTGQTMDAGGRMAAQGRVDVARVERALQNPWFGRTPPKSLDRQDFTSALAAGLGPADGAATLVAIMAATVQAATLHLPARPRRWLVTGGGRHNAAIMAALEKILAAPVQPVEAVGWDGDALEAQAFAFLAVRSLKGLPLSLPSTTGVNRPMPGGRLWRA